MESPITLSLLAISRLLFNDTSLLKREVPLIIKLPFPVINPPTNSRFVVLISKVLAVLGEIYPVIAVEGIEFAG